MVDRQFLDLQPSETPLRKINIRSANRMTGFIVSRLRPGVCIDHESENEAAFIIRAELDPRVTAIYEQPLELIYRDASGIRKAFPDFCITVDDRVEWHEVKEDDKYADPEEQERHLWIAREFDRRGHRYSITLRSQLRAQPEYRHLNGVLRRLHTKVGPELWSRMAAAMAHQPKLISDLLRETERFGATFETVLALICSRKLCADIARGVTEETTVYPAGTVKFPRLIPFTSPLEGRR
ncbi:MAG TPA: TnsA endonuclease N-terminal domain-containing protein [Allosphingosinicella sp.]